ncbi:YheC/YheD family protein [Neobacillus sp. FSL H8-0543]|uniref:YheC/YheD family protein n=1 Tax=Neobacillus sp. FSL H8-0543 TaxID=2954672 RepID=UPI0031594B1A
MENVIELSSSTHNAGRLTLHPNLARSFGLKRQTKKRIRFGSKAVQATIYLSKHLPQNKASLSTDILDKLSLPQHCSLEITNRGDEILIGPFIGLLVGDEQDSIDNQLNNLLDYLFHYREIRGAIMAFSLENVDKVNLTMQGYLFNPKTKKWEQGIFPYPSSIFVMSTSVSSDWADHFQAIIGNSFFNHSRLNKWDAHKRLASSIGIKNYLPDAMLHGKPKDFYWFLKKFSTVDVKSIKMEDRSPIKVILKDKNNMLISNPNTNEIKNYSFYSRGQAYSVFDKYFHAGDYMIQESIDVPGYQNIEFRVLIVKDKWGKWQAKGIFTREKDSENLSKFISPIVKLEKEHLKDLLQRGDVYISMVYQEIIYIAIEAVEALEDSDSNLANAAVDMVIGEIGDIWISNVNHCHPSHEIALVAGYPEVYYEILKTNMLYARKLAGF